MGTISLTTIGPDGLANASAPVESNFQTIKNLVNGNLGDANFKEMSLGKLLASGASQGALPFHNGTVWTPGLAPTSTGDLMQWDHTLKRWGPSATGALTTGDLLQWNGTGWADVTPVEAELPGAEIAYGEKTSNQTITATTTDVISLGAVTYVNEPIYLEFSAAAVSVPGAVGVNGVTFSVWDDTTELFDIGHIAAGADAATDITVPIRLARKITPSAASHTYKVRVKRGLVNGTLLAGAGTAGTYVPAWFRAVYA